MSIWKNESSFCKRTLKPLLIVAGWMLVALIADKLHAAEESTLVTLELGQVRGVQEEGIVVFKGLPYAQPPVGDQRWRAPRPPQPWEGVRDASSFGPGCVFIDGSRMTEGRWQTEGRIDLFIDVPLLDSTNEDCLYLNVWAPTNASDAPVMVWLQPTGSSSMPLFDGSSFARDGVVFVSMDFRQLSLGNFAHPALTSEVAGDSPLGRFQTLDQIAALQWVQNHIAAFGGEPSRVTVFGQSAGGASVLQLLTLPETKGLISQAIVQSSGGWFEPLDLAQMERLGTAIATRAGLPGGDATAEQLRALPAQALAQVGAYSIDGRFQTASATSLIEAGQFHDIPLLIGWTDNDGSSLRSSPPQEVVKRASPELLTAYGGDRQEGEALGYQLYTDQHVAAPTRWVASKAAEGAPAYVYVYSHVSSLQRGRTSGANHGAELPFVFDIWQKALPQLPLDEADRAVTRLMHSCWTSFAKYGEPRCMGAPAWPRFDQEMEQLMVLGAEPRVVSHFRQLQLDAQQDAWRREAESRAESVEVSVWRAEQVLLHTTSDQP